MDKNDYSFSKIKTGIDNFLKNTEIYTIEKIKDGYAVGTVSGGLVFFDDNLNYKYNQNKNNGLTSNAVYSLLTDYNNDLWIGTSKGINQNLNSLGIWQLSENNGISGVIQYFKIVDNKIYVSTDERLQVLKKTLDSSFYQTFVPIASQTNYCFFLEKIGNSGDMYGSSLRSFFRLDQNDNYEKLNKIYSVYTYTKITDTKYFVGYYEGGYFLDFVEKGNSFDLKIDRKIKNFNNFITTSFLDTENNLWFSTLNEGVYFLPLNNVENAPIYFGKLSGLPDAENNKVLYVNKKIYVSTVEGLYEKHKTNEGIKFKPTNDFSLNFQEDSLQIYTIKKSPTGKFWLSTSKGIRIYNPENKLLKSINLLEEANFEYTQFYFDHKNNVWFSTSEAIYRVNENEILNAEKLDIDVKIRSVKIGNDIKIYFNKKIESDIYEYEKNTITLKNKLSPNDNTIRIDYALGFFAKYKKNLYATKLVGYDDDFSEWTNQTSVEYKKLPAGKYELHLKAKNMLGEEAKIAILRFEIEKQWYVKTWVIVLYFLVAIFSLLLSAYIVRQKIKNDKEKFDNAIKLKTKNFEKERLRLEKEAEVLREEKVKLENDKKNLLLRNDEYKHLKTIPKLTTNSVLITDRRGNFEWWNRQFSIIFHYKYQKYKDLNFRDKPKKIRPDLIKEIKNYSKDMGRINYTTYEKYENGEELWFQTTISPIIDDNGFISRFVVIDKDLTNQKLAERVIEEKNEILLKNGKKLLDLELDKKRKDKIIEEGYKSITKGVRYAHKLQNQLMPCHKEICNYIKSYFIISKPRDIVSGDFYWITEKNDKTIFAVADCTGHGIPGAFMTMLGIYVLREVVCNSSDIQANTLLKDFKLELNKDLKKAIKFVEDNDNIDISLCVLDKKNNKLQISAINQQVYVANNKEIISLEPNKTSLNQQINNKINYNFHEIDVETNDKVYMFTDGYYDQFGGFKNKKLHRKNFKRIINEVKNLEMADQRKALLNEFYRWKGENLQVDDVLILGFSIP